MKTNIPTPINFVSKSLERVLNRGNVSSWPLAILLAALTIVAPAGAQSDAVKAAIPEVTALPGVPTLDVRPFKLFDETPSARPLPNIEKYKAFDAYYAWRREQNKGK